MTSTASRVLLAATLAVAGAVPAATAHAAPGPKTFYASADGRGSACNQVRPCSVSSAKAKVAGAIADGMTRDIRVVMAGGRYTTPLTLGSADSGRGKQRVTWAAATGARPVFDGGARLTGWQPGSDGRWVAKVPAGVTPRQLFVNDVRAERARGDACAKTVCDATKDGMTGAVASGVAGWSRPTDAEAVIKVRWRNYHCRIAGVTGDVLTFAQPCWTNSSSGTNRTGPAWDSTTVDSTRYDGVAFFENAPELLNKPGEFVWNSASRTITYLPRQGEDLRHATVVAPQQESMIVLDGARNVTLEGLAIRHTAYDQPSTDEGYAGMQAGLTLTGATGPVDHAGRYYTKPAAAIRVSGGRGISLTGLDVRHLGGAGAILEKGTQQSTITRSTFDDLSSGAVYVGDTEPNPATDLQSIGNTVSYNTIRDIGVDYTDAVGIWGGYEIGLKVEHNSLEHLPYSGISVGWGWNQPEAQKPVSRDNIIRANRILDVMRVEDGQHDGGAIYTQGPQPGTVISENYINRSAYGNTERDGNGIYLDEQSSYITVERNVITRAAYKWVSNWAGYGIENIARHNWVDTDAPALSGRGSQLVDNLTKLETLPADAVAVARAAGARPDAVEQLKPNLARHGVASQSSNEGSATAAAAVDGSTVTDSRTQSAASSWWQVDLGSEQSIKQVVLWNDAGMTTQNVDVLVSSNPDFAGATRVHLDGKALRPTEVDLSTTGRYVRVQGSASVGRIGLSEVQIHP
ncbi:right-handed parallel beta-helix repeat-containing protein [Luteipulveratus mongoliensis]|nr:right-handed parallel beta-helix repeat-containing protein [Luteipulveratus mongoliensis]